MSPLYFRGVLQVKVIESEVDCTEAAVASPGMPQAVRTLTASL